MAVAVELVQELRVLVVQEVVALVRQVLAMALEEPLTRGVAAGVA